MTDSNQTCWTVVSSAVVCSSEFRPGKLASEWFDQALFSLASNCSLDNFNPPDMFHLHTFCLAPLPSPVSYCSSALTSTTHDENSSFLGKAKLNSLSRFSSVISYYMFHSFYALNSSFSLPGLDCS